MHLLSSRLCAQITSAPLVRLAPVTMSQRHNSARTQANLLTYLTVQSPS